MPTSATPMVVLVTGATRGIGLALAEAASAVGHQVALNRRSASSTEEARAIAARLSYQSGNVHPLQADVTVAAEARRLIDDTVARFGRIDAVINNAGVGERIALADLDEEAFARTLQARLTSAFLVSQAAWPHMTRHGGHSIDTTSIARRFRIRNGPKEER